MLANILDELGGRGISALIGVVFGGLMAWLFGRWRRLKERRSILRGDARDTVVINLHLVETAEVRDTSDGSVRRVPRSLRIRALGQAELNLVVPNGHLERILMRRAFEVTPGHTLISMEGPEGSYLLETLTGFVCDRVANAPFDHDLYVMAPCCEPQELAEHQPITILLVSVANLALFDNWPACKNIRVEHGSDGARILTLMNMAARFKVEQEKLAELRRTGQRTRFVETMYVLDLSLDKRSAPIPTKDVPWGRFENVLKQMNLE
jgi:hypothetical protein